MMPRSEGKIITIPDVKLLVETKPEDPDAGAYLVEVDDTQAWVPKSMAVYDEDDKTLQLPEWMAIEKELI